SQRCDIVAKQTRSHPIAASPAVLFIELNRRVIKTHAVCHGAGCVSASERAMRDRESRRRLEHAGSAHELNPDVAAESPEKLNDLRIALPNPDVVRDLRIGLVHIPSAMNLPGSAQRSATLTFAGPVGRWTRVAICTRIGQRPNEDRRLALYERCPLVVPT